MADTPREKHLLLAATAGAPADLVRHWQAWRAECSELAGLRPLEHRLLPLVWPLARQAGTEDPDAAALDGIYKSSWMRNEMLLRQASDVQGRLAEAGVPSLLFKGASLLLRAYPDVSSRPSADLDVLIRPSDLRTASRTLGSKFPVRSYGGHSVTLIGDAMHSLDLHVMPSHWTLARGTTRDEERRISVMLERAETVERASRRFTVPEPTDLLFLHLLNVFAHGPHSGIDHAYCLVDAQQLMSRRRLDEDRLVSLMRDHECVPLFQHQFAADDDLLPDRLRPLAARVARLELTRADEAVSRGLSNLGRARSGGLGGTTWRDWWLAVRGYDPAAPSVGSRLAFIAYSARNLVRDALVNADRRRKVFTQPARYLHKTIGLLWR